MSIKVFWCVTVCPDFSTPLINALFSFQVPKFAGTDHVYVTGCGTDAECV
jgi:hypothetical protein